MPATFVYIVLIVRVIPIYVLYALAEKYIYNKTSDKQTSSKPLVNYDGQIVISATTLVTTLQSCFFFMYILFIFKQSLLCLR